MPDVPSGSEAPQDHQAEVERYAIERMRPSGAGRVEELKRVINAVISTARAEPVEDGEEPLSFVEILGVEVRPDALPASSILFTAPAETDSETGGVTENTWTFIQRGYYDFTDQARSQHEHERLTPAIFAAFRINDEVQLEDGSFVSFRVADGGPPQPLVEIGLFTKTLRITATTDEEEPETDED